MAANGGGFWPRWEDNKLFTVIFAILLVYGIVLVGALIRESMIKTSLIGVADRPASTITVTAMDKALVTPDVATVDIGVTTDSATATKAQSDNSTKANAILAAVKAVGVAEADIQTSSFNVYPQYDYNQSPAKIVGYEASETITVKIRDQALTSTVLQKAGDAGATNIGSLQFTVDDQSAAEAEARKKAIAKAYEQALAIAGDMGARLGSVVSYSENSGGSVPPMMYDRLSAGMGGGSTAPDISVGQNEIDMTVYIEYSIQ